MFSILIGNLDWPSAAALIVLFASISAAGLAIITKHKSKDEIEIEKMKIQNSREESLYMRETNRIVETKKLEQNLITSHREG